VQIPNQSISQNSCTAIKNIGSSFVCTVTNSSITITQGYQASSLNAPQNVSFLIGSIRNPVSMKPTSSFIVSIYNSDGYL